MRLLPLVSAAAALALSACGISPYPANPDRVTLMGDTLTVHFFDGTSCKADVREAPAGHFPACGQPMDYDVEILHKALMGSGPLATQPYAHIRLTRVSDGRVWLWETPQEARSGQSMTDPVHYF